jgi:hypothetical protein
VPRQRDAGCLTRWKERNGARYLVRSDLVRRGHRGAEIVAGVVAAAGLLLTIAVLPEPKGKTLEQPSADTYAPETLKLEAAS